MKTGSILQKMNIIGMKHKCNNNITIESNLATMRKHNHSIFIYNYCLINSFELIIRRLYITVQPI
jgi:hypothetical protein